ncbi:hypothetical protein JSE7799_03138 [Jannaschia seosinensis]|uniref:Uncharacterized protein n=1 Tax=Jannaschia seosinensis TaxID=313367 RepID=A0A0M7BGE0_9RHOB|nr:hypothetical protein JSE7799_03138 [Jannaschia seosinensis]
MTQRKNLSSRVVQLTETRTITVSGTNSEKQTGTADSGDAKIIVSAAAMPPDSRALPHIDTARMIVARHRELNYRSDRLVFAKLKATG